MNNVDWWLAYRYFRSKKSDSFVSMMTGFSLVGIALGVATLIVVMAVMTGLREDLMERVLGVQGHLNMYNNGKPELSDYDALSKELQDRPFVQSATPVIEQHTLITAKDRFQGAIVHGLTYADMQKRPFISNNLKAGKIPSNETDTSVGIGILLATKYGLRVGDQITFVNPLGVQGPFGPMPRSGAYTIGFIFEAGYTEYDKNFVFMPLHLAQKFFNYDTSVTHIEILVKDPKESVQNMLDLRESFGSAYRFYDWQTTNSGFVGALKVQQNVMFIILSLIILIAAFNIISSMTMLVQKKMKDIAILRTQGLRRKSVLNVFFIMGALIGVIGTLSGLILGLLVALNIDALRRGLEALSGWKLFHEEIFFLTNLPAKVIPSDVITVIIMSLIISFLSTLYPAWRASKLDPVEALRYE